MKKCVYLSLLVFVLAAPALLAAPPWTGAAGAGVPDEASAGLYELDTGSAKHNASGSTATLVFRYVLTDTSATGAPNWTTLAVDAYDPGTSSQVRAQLYRLTPGGTNFMITSCTSNDAAFTAPPPALCSIPSTSTRAATPTRWSSASPAPARRSRRSSARSGCTDTTRVSAREGAHPGPQRRRKR